MAKQLALVTGGMGGLGEAISLKLYDAGYRVVHLFDEQYWRQELACTEGC
jgi:NAD(P)-dependent dehydrogenase (short-subunit alcohol dehydrogenase family)